MLSGTSDENGRVPLTAEQEKALGDVRAQSPGELWLLFEGQTKQLEVTREREGWTDQQQLDHALDAMGYADRYGVAGDQSTDAFRAPLARIDLMMNSATAIFERFKKDPA